MPYVKPLKPFESKFSHAIARRDTLGETMWLNPQDYEELSEREGGPYFINIDSQIQEGGIQKGGNTGSPVNPPPIHLRPKTPPPKYKKNKEAK